jgi:hypothetical protein
MIPVTYQMFIKNISVAEKKLTEFMIILPHNEQIY